MGDLNIDLLNCSNRKWLNLTQLFELKQLNISDPTRITNKTSTLIDHLYCSNPENISDCFVSHYSISDHFPACFPKKINSKIKKTTLYTSTLYRCFKNFNEELSLSDLANDFNTFSVSQSDIDDDITTWYECILKQLDRHAPVKTKRIKTKRLPKWYKTETAQALYIYNKRKQNWAEYKRYRNLTNH